MPIASCGLKLDDEALRVAVGLRLGLDLCVPHGCHCGSRVDICGVHSFVCKRAPGRTSRHHAFNDLIARAFSSAGFRVTKEPSGFVRIRWQAERWPHTCSLVERQSAMLGCHSNMSTG